MEYIISEESRSDFKVGAKSSGLIDFLLSHRFILTAFCFKKIFHMIDPLTRMLQAIDIDLLSAANNIQNVHTSLKQMRCENIFEEIYKESKSFMSDQADKFEFTQLAVTRSRTKRKQTDENARDEPITDPKLKFQIDTYFGTLYAAIMAIENRSTQLHKIF